MTIVSDVLHFIESQEDRRAEWWRVVEHFHPEAKVHGCGWKTPRGVLQSHTPTLPVDLLPTTWPAEDAMDFLLDKGTLAEPIVGTVAIAYATEVTDV